MADSAAIGDTVHVHYTVSLEDGRVVDSSRERGPFAVTLGQGQVIKGFERALIGMTEGQQKKVVVRAAEAYGPRRSELVHEIPRAQIPPHVDVSVGQRLQASDQGGKTVSLTVVEAGKTSVKLDANHPLAGEDLTFELEVMKIA
jgi:peptidylprolyl isomerase